MNNLILFTTSLCMKIYDNRGVKTLQESEILTVLYFKTSTNTQSLLLLNFL